MVIVDTGPLVALFDKTEPAHDRCHAALKQIKASPVTTWPVLTEAFYLLGEWEKGQKKLWDFILSGGLRIDEIPYECYHRMRELMEKYADKPMDFADASLVVLSEQTRQKPSLRSIETIFPFTVRNTPRISG
jgi:predicted nucleic acid-binding protein